MPINTLNIYGIMMDFLQKLILTEQQKNTEREVLYAVQIINKVYSDWKATGRRKNAIDLVASSVNRISRLSPELLPHLYDSIVMKLCTIIMRCMDIPVWKDIQTKKMVYKKLYPLIDKIEHVNLNTGTDGTLRQIIMTRLSAAIAHQDDPEVKVFVTYEPRMPTSYLNFIFRDKSPHKCYRMQALPLPAEFDSLIEILNINHKKAKSQLSQQGQTRNLRSDNQQDYTPQKSSRSDKNKLGVSARETTQQADISKSDRPDQNNKLY